MASISHIFNIARSGIQAHQQGLATTAHNISNINTKCYSGLVNYGMENVLQGSGVATEMRFCMDAACVCTLWPSRP